MEKPVPLGHRFLWLTISTILLTIAFLVNYMEKEIPVVLAVHSQEKIVALTFDDGPDPRFTPKVLDILKKEKISATFFVIGKSIVKYHDIDKRYSQEGHELGNHTFNHAKLLSLTNMQVNKEIAETNKVIFNLTGQRVKWFRPPRREYNNDILMLAEKNGLDTVLWNVSMENHLVTEPKDMAERVICKVRPGSIILLHDGILDRTKSVEALPLVIQSLKEKGYKFVTLSNLLRDKYNDKNNSNPKINESI